VGEADGGHAGGAAASFIDAASPDMRQLLGLNYPYPEVLDAAEGGNTEGRR
jgi:Ni,Fe-hydrogenase I small subunit